MPVVALDHVNITAPADLLAACRDFYVEVLGLAVGYRPPFRRPGTWLYVGDRPAVHLVTGSSQAPAPESSLNHIAFTCSDIGDMTARLEARAIPFERTVVPATGDEQLFLNDPAGVPIELRFPR
jgi:catechol 2,3-dioxygenase-like lactoylglutathione lyase family enzyme